MRRKAFTWWQAVLVLAGLALIAAILFPIFGRARDNGGRKSSCQSNLKQIGLGIAQYLQDYEEKYPRVNLGAQGWMDILQPYLKSTQIFQCPNDISSNHNSTTDYFYNARLSGVPQASLNYISNTIELGDSISDAPSNFSLTKFPSNWANDSTSPAYRHLEGANYGYADGHVKWIKPSNVTNKEPNSSVSTFAP